MCSDGDLARHRRRLSGPLLDRIDVFAQLVADSGHDQSTRPDTTSLHAAEQVSQARERQTRRLRDDGVAVNAHMDTRMLHKHVRLDQKGDEMLRNAARSGMLSTRGQHRVLRLARTIADLNGSGRVRPGDIGTAIALRPEAAVAGSRPV
jgi:magnesium chelatase family protein